MKNLTLRILTMVVLIPLVILILWLGGWVFYGFLAVLWVLMLYEWFFLVQKKPLWVIGGCLYISLAVSCTFLFYAFIGWEFFLLFLTMVWMSDIGGYVFGKWLGGPKLAPRISPKKTWAGLLGGVGLSVLTVLIVAGATQLWIMLNQNDYQYHDQYYMVLELEFLLWAVFIPLLATVGDLMESAVKRRFGVKDSGNIIPGHGGILDRVDGALLVFIVLGAYPLYLGSGLIKFAGFMGFL